MGTLCTDGAPAMLGNISGLAALVKKEAPVFGHMNDVSLSIQGRTVTIMDASETLQALLAKLPLWKKRLEVHNYANLPIYWRKCSYRKIKSYKCLYMQKCVDIWKP